MSRDDASKLEGVNEVVPMNRPLATRTSAPSTSAHHKALRCASRVLRPLLRVLRAAGLSREQLIQVCQKNINELAAQAFRARKSGLPRHELLEEIVAQWRNNPAYLDRGGSMRLSVRGKKPSFQSLVRSVAPRLPAKLALSALKRGRVVRVGSDGRVALVTDFYPARAHGEVELDFFTKATVDFLRTQEFNYLNNPPLGHGLFQRVAHKMNSDARLAPAFNRYVREQAQLFLEMVDGWLTRHQPKRRRSRTRRRARLGVGVYVINETLR